MYYITECNRPLTSDHQLGHTVNMSRRKEFKKRRTNLLLDIKNSFIHTVVMNKRAEDK